MRQNIAYLAMALIGGSFISCIQAADATPRKAEAAKVETASLPALPAGEWLAAGPVRVKLEDGELRYLHVGDKEIVRRIYFGVRDGKWNTASPKFSKIDVEKSDDHFTVNLAANCKMDAIDFSWTGVITGTPDGKITFAATGTPHSDFDSNRIGLCTLFGVHSLAGQEFETDGEVPRAEFPKLVWPKLVASQFHKLQYTTPAGLGVSVSLDGAIFDMEDQRNWGDSSWKAYAPLPYAYKKVTKGDTKTETVTVTVSGKTDGVVSEQDPVHVKVGETMHRRVPAFVALPTGKVDGFTEFSFGRDKFKDAKEIAWSYIPTTHLLDSDVIMENLPSVAYQSQTVKSVNPDCRTRIGPIGISDAGAKDARANTPLAAAWEVAMVKFLALGNVDEAAFSLGDGLPAVALDAVRPYEKHPLVSTETEPAHAYRVIAFAAENEKGTGLFLINPTSHVSHAEVDGLNVKQVQVLRVAAGAKEQASDVVDETLKIELAPYEVVRVTIGN